MFEENALEFSVGQEVAWIVELVNGSALGWPDDVLVDITIEIERPGPGRAALARSPEFCVLWEGDEPAGTTLTLRGGLSAEWFMPGFRTTAEGQIQRIHIVSRRMVWDADYTVVRPIGEWHLEEVSRSPGWLGPSPRPRDPPEVLHPWGLFVALDLKAITIPDR
jgi:hypothetical protein